VSNVTTTEPTVATAPLVEINDLRIVSGDAASPRAIVQRIDFDIAPGRRIGIVGESGSGKSMTAGAIMGLLPEGVRVESGSIRTGDFELVGLSERALRAVRGRVISIVYQNALSALNPVFPVGRQIADVARAHLGLGKKAAHARAVELMTEMGIPEAARRALDYPHQFSGGMAQRVAIAMALVGEPQLLIADEPTTGLDATIQVQVLATIDRSIAGTGSALLLISHDLGAVRNMTDEVIVLYAGMVLERGTTEEVMNDPLNPYTRGLVASADQTGGTISFIPGRIPEPGSVSESSCPFADRCPLVTERCRTERPGLRPTSTGRLVACHNVELP